MLGHSVKTLADYEQLIKKGKNLAFDFKLNQEKGIGILRKFIKQNNNKLNY